MEYLAHAARHAGHDDMAMNGTATATASAAASTASAAMSHGGHGGMGGGNACKISMLWNWNTIDSCFLSKSWHVRSKAMFGGSVVGVFFLCMAIEAVRAAARAYDRKLVAARVAAISADKGGPVGPVQPTLLQQLVRALAYGVQFTGAFLVMLLGMYYNGYILFAIFLGHTIGYFVFGRDTVAASAEHTSSGCAC
ncbi:copper transporter complex subunit Ctr4 [Vanrija albida]|uniref:Copper transport protein n=1 Tax=Vanrija albida TaxID=181172 RepID=A0ABR3Q7H8_9TREE